jgi:hypothetical protein
MQVCALQKEMTMEKAYWLGRKRASHRAATSATSSIARLIHYDLARRCSVKAQSPETAALDLAVSLPPPIFAEGDGDVDPSTRHA